MKSGEILRRSAYFSDDDLNFTRGVVRCQGMWDPDSKCFKMVPKHLQLGGLMPNFSGHIALILGCV